MKCIHHNDLDGKCAGALVAYHTGNYNKDDYFESSYEHDLPYDKIKDNETVYIVDMAFSVPEVLRLEKLYEITKNIIWIDHHISSITLEEQYPKYSMLDGIRYVGVSGAKLTYFYFHSVNKESFDRASTLPSIDLVSDYDCWHLKLQDSLAYKLGVDTYKHDPLSDFWATTFKQEESSVTNLTTTVIKKGRTITEYLNQKNKLDLEHFGFEAIFDNTLCYAINQKANSMVFGKKFYQYDFVVSFVFNGTDWMYTLYSSSPKINCCTIAEKYHGGGHVGAAGFISKELLIKKSQSDI